MAPTLDDLLGIDPDDPHTAAALEDSEDYADLVEALVVMRRKRGLSQQDVAERMGTTQSTISNFERVGGDARYSTLQRYARAVGVRLHSMVGHPGAALAPAWRLATEVPVRVAVRERDHGRLTREWTGQEHRSVRVR